MPLDQQRTEICPVCDEMFAYHKKALKHYWVHVQNGELIGRWPITTPEGEILEAMPVEFRLPNTPDRAPYWWKAGYHGHYQAGVDHRTQKWFASYKAKWHKRHTD